ncbi:1-aminocyclopropane-1-carboxylate deaminase/D-cysteine desulfhydrase [Marinobacterium arenosum]|uniref:1-aminocyclopropane-1-carboxylate deaminase/D-cysteine desulfhydrase n=1 Tax=Marinobacterium arenosum TaxID=2862496 RepID=UPI001C965832|nr:pyridoxal-phosphate dependent enzyme [Marinobacterium arenosum]MBY4677979.1 pyridoxal-phosphate dependent enzyme [Marinobacterium arenosum]
MTVDLLTYQPPLELQLLQHPLHRRRAVELWVLRLDRSHPRISGNKWYKLQPNLQQAVAQGARCLVSFGGAYSNHIHALAWAGRQLAIETVGVIRGEPEYAENPTLGDAGRWGMRLRFVDRASYRRRHDADWQRSLLAEYPDAFLIPEGGSNPLAVRGGARLAQQIAALTLQPDWLVTACGTGGTLAGLLAGADPRWRLLGIAVLKKAAFLYDDINALLAQAELPARARWCIDLAGDVGGYGKVPSQLIDFMADFEQRHALPLDPVYTGKMFWRLQQLIESGCFPAGSRLLALHTGGLQGRRGVVGLAGRG